MPWQLASTIVLSEKQKQILTEYAVGTHSPMHLKTRSQIILKASIGSSNNSIEREMGLDPTTVKCWRDRFCNSYEELKRIEAETPLKLRGAIIKVLSDEQRPGGPSKFADEQVAAIMAVACEDPAKFELSFSHWTPELLRIEVIKLGIVDNISIRQIGRFLKERDLKPHRVQYWLNPNIEDMEEFQQQVEAVCAIYLEADKLNEEGTLVYSTDEKTGIQAREHVNPRQQMKPGQPERVDPEYIRHGTSGLIASRNVATGEIVEPIVQPTRKEEDYVLHIESVFSVNPDKKHVFINDNLNIHMSESLVILVAGVEGIDVTTLGVKGKSGVLKSMASRAEFLSIKTHQISFVYTPKHCSWLNQIECWFGIITRRLLNRRASFKSVEELEQKIRGFIDYYNRFLKKPFRWNYKGKLLMA